MEKIININFQARIIAIEETAYNNLRQYTDSLRRHFADEESSDEIINDIENRIAELLSERLKQGAACIKMSDLNAVMDSIGRLEDIEAAEGEENKTGKRPAPEPGEGNKNGKARLYRSTDDKMIVGVCSGIAVHTGIDPTLVRILFVVLIAPLFWVYILMWLIVPGKSIRSNVTKRLYRNPDNKMIAGVCGGLSAYFHIDAWMLRTVFIIPFVITLVSGEIAPNWDWEPRIFAGSFGGSLFLLYLILWIVVPYASSSTDRMEMRGEKIDLNTIKAATQARAGNAVNTARPIGSQIGKVIGILFKAFFLLIAGVVALSLFGVLIGLVFAGTAAMPFTHFLFDSGEQYKLAWAGISLTLGIPLLALIVWLVRRLTGARSHHHYLAYIFAGLWLAGITCTIISTASMLRNFSARSVVEETYVMQQPSAGRLHITVSKNEGARHHARHDRWFGEWDDNEMPFRYISADSLWLNNVKVNIEQSPDSQFHIYTTRASRGITAADAVKRAEHIAFGITQQDTIVSLPDGFTIGSEDKFRVQQVLVTVEVPVGKTVQVSSEVNDYSWYNINTHGRGRYERHWSYGNDYYHSNTEYIMTASGLQDPTDTAVRSRSYDE